ncbi:L,D-transpeptidase family protein [Streptomyces sp. TRM76323]|uniref:L,D-transpeptidase family protein n=1 Tax=Streptomyces tamarix TaxID=3078565 RepID=A0ABU3QNE0_9ACTN|nr:L,D-transpeptidase family protein [Streptomyces tamarix]MDT9684276.1 L,D-transpeptidase family protein [Streptomyces tamarix]
MPVLRRPRRRLLAATLLLALLPLSACAAGGDGAGAGGRDRGPGAATATRSQEGHAPPRAVPGPPAAPASIPGLGPATRAAIPHDSRQALVVQGHGRDVNTGTATLYERRPGTGWTAVSEPWPAHNGVRGWTDHHVQDDLRSPIGVFGLTDAGGLLPDPGAKLPYDQNADFTATGSGSLGEPLEGSFDYVVAINYNRVSGTTPLDLTRPLGEERGGGIWIHVDHDGPTQGCVSLGRAHMRELLRWLDPAHKPVVVMGDVQSLGL